MRNVFRHDSRLARIVRHPGAWLFCLLPLLTLLHCGCGPASESTSKAEPLRILCGSSMAPPVQILIQQFTAKHGPVALDIGASETLLPRVLAGAPADIFICHDPFEQKVREGGKLARSVSHGLLAPVVLVRPGNPHTITNLAGLSRPGLKLGIGAPQYSTCGELFVQALRDANLYEPVMTNVVYQGRTHAEIANGLILGPLDAVVVWNYVSLMYTNKAALAPVEIKSAPVRVTTLGLTASPNPRLRDQFLDFMDSEAARRVFVEHGYTARP